ncbi:Ovule protein [Caenorhabditis elegans]|uniref:Ovule protein n=1 Tax=Caenorhabditis elegans TaxID=6239 RepID=A0A5E4M2G1_CAEEL|nr:Ovule protein [Caenorhabditis elegans]VVC12353.1 Ovule protein [Caenorhabditis elegans]
MTNRRAKRFAWLETSRSLICTNLLFHGQRNGSKIEPKYWSSATELTMILPRSWKITKWDWKIIFHRTTLFDWKQK